MIYKHDYQRMALDTDRMMITQCGSDYHDYSNDKLARIYSSGQRNIVLNVCK